MLHHEYDKKRDELKNKAHGSVIDKYGGKEHLETPDPSLLFSQSENYTEYSRSGKIIKGQEKQAVLSSYEEDIYPNNHKSVWGSFWQSGKWGYACCHSFNKQSYCVGEKGKEALACAQTIGENEAFNKDAAVDVIDDNVDVQKITKELSSNSSSDNNDDDVVVKSKTERNKDSSKKKKRRKQKDKRKEKRKEKKKNNDGVNDDDDDDPLKKALRAEEKAQKEANELLNMDERKRPYNSMFHTKEPTAEQVEAFQMKRRRDEDPMANFM